MISRSIFLKLICHHRQMHCSLGFILCCVHGRHDISSPLVKSYAFDLFAFFFCLLIHVCYNPHALFLFAQLFPKLISVGCLNLIEASPITICFSFVLFDSMMLLIVPSVIQLTIIPLIYIIDNINQVRICVMVII